MKNLNLNLLKELSFEEGKEIDGGYVPGDVVTDSSGNMYRLDYIIGGTQFWTKLPNNVC